MEQITDDRGRLIGTDWEGEDNNPLPGSVVLAEGVHGTAWQRHFNDGLWHSTRGGRPITWADILRKRNLWLAYDCHARSSAA